MLTKIFSSIDIYYCNNNISFYHTNSNYCTTLQGQYHGERNDNDYPVARGGTRNFPTEGLELPAGGLKWLKNGVFVHYFAENPRFPLTRGLGASDWGL